jgi:hypothetical protein
VEGMLKDGDDVPEWLVKKEYNIEWVFTTSALLHSCEQYIYRHRRHSMCQRHNPTAVEPIMQIL